MCLCMPLCIMRVCIMHVVHVQCICTKPSCHLLLQAFYPSKLHQDFCPSRQAAHVNCKERENSPRSLASSNASSASPLQALLYKCDLSAHCRHTLYNSFWASYSFRFYCTLVHFAKFVPEKIVIARERPRFPFQEESKCPLGLVVTHKPNIAELQHICM